MATNDYRADDRRLDKRGEPDANRDPISGEKGAHPVGTGVGAAAGGAAGMAIGAIGGPIGAGIGAAVGAIAGGLVGKGTAEAVNPTVEDEYWRESFADRPYVESGATYDTYRPAYQYGWENRARYDAGTTFDQAEKDLRRDWETKNTGAGLSWDKAKNAVKDSWERVSDSSSRSSSKPGSCGMPGRGDTGGCGCG